MDWFSFGCSSPKKPQKPNQATENAIHWPQSDDLNDLNDLIQRNIGGDAWLESSVHVFPALPSPARRDLKLHNWRGI